MASQNESNQKPGDGDSQENDRDVGPDRSRSTDVEAKEVEYEHFSNDDPFGPARISALRSETEELLAPLQTEPVGFDGATEAELRDFQEDAVQRSKWSQTRQDGFLGLLRLGRPTPPRSQRVL